MSRNTLLFFASLLAIIAGGLVSYFPPTQNGVAIWSLVSMFVGYGIRDLFIKDEIAAPPAPPAALAPPPISSVPAATPADLPKP
jgi:hypothetical protein